jgi:hypothetical protein
MTLAIESPICDRRPMELPPRSQELVEATLLQRREKGVNVWIEFTIYIGGRRGITSGGEAASATNRPG